MLGDPANLDILWYINGYGDTCNLLIDSYYVLPTLRDFSQYANSLNGNFLVYNCAPFELKYYHSKTHEYFAYQSLLSNITAMKLYNIDSSITNLFDIYPLTYILGGQSPQQLSNNVKNTLSNISHSYQFNNSKWFTKTTMQDLQQGIKLHSNFNSIEKTVNNWHHFAQEKLRNTNARKRRNVNSMGRTIGQGRSGMIDNVVNLVDSRSRGRVVTRGRGKGKGKGQERGKDWINSLAEQGQDKKKKKYYHEFDQFDETLVVQKLIDNPWLMEGKYVTKIRVHILVTCLNPLEAWISRHYIFMRAVNELNKIDEKNGSIVWDNYDEKSWIVGLNHARDMSENVTQYRNAQFLRFHLNSIVATGDKKLDTKDLIEKRANIVNKNIDKVLKFQLAAFHNDFLLKRIDLQRDDQTNEKILKYDILKGSLINKENINGFSDDDIFLFSNDDYQAFISSYFGNNEKSMSNKNIMYRFYNRVIDSMDNSIFNYHYCADLALDNKLNVYLIEINTNCGSGPSPQSRNSLVDRTLYSFNIALETLFRNNYLKNINNTSILSQQDWFLDHGSWQPLVKFERFDVPN